MATAKWYKKPVGLGVGGSANLSPWTMVEPQLFFRTLVIWRHISWKMPPKIKKILDLEQELSFRTTVFLRLSKYLQRSFLSHFSFRLLCHSSHLISLLLTASQPRYYDTTLQPHYEDTIAGSLVLGSVNATVIQSKVFFREIPFLI